MQVDSHRGVEGTLHPEENTNTAIVTVKEIAAENYRLDAKHYVGKKRKEKAKNSQGDVDVNFPFAIKRNNKGEPDDRT